MIRITKHLLLLFFLIALSGISTFGQSQHSIIFALSDYWKYGHRWHDINSNNDAELLKEALLSQGFGSDNIHVITNSETKEDILDAIDNIAIKSARSGDFIHIHFSGHGQQVADTNGDEIDGYDEALVPLSAPSSHKYKNKSDKEVIYNGNRHLIDDEFGEALQAVRKHLGPEGELLVTIDACHSGTSTRGIGLARGSAIRIEPENYVPKQELISDNNWLSTEVSADNLARMVTFYASSSQELNYEYRADDGNHYGPLSYAVSSAISQGYLNSSFEELFYKVKQNMIEIAPNQSPFADGLDVKGLNGESSLTTHWITDWISENEFELSSGFLMGIREGSIVEGITPTGARWTARIAESGPTKSKGKVIGKGGSEISSANFVKLILPKFDNAGSICLDVHRKDDIETLKSSLGQFNFSEEGCSFQLSLNNNQLDVYNSRGVQLESFVPKRDSNGQLSGQSLDSVREVLTEAANAQILTEVSLDDPALNATLDYYLLTPKEGVSQPAKLSDFIARERLVSINEVLKIKEGAFLEFRVTNKSSVPIHYALIDIMPNSEFSLLIPRPGKSSDEFYLEPGQSNERRNQFFQIGPPYGLETMKLIISEKPIDWNSLNSTRGGVEEKTEFEKAIQSMMSGNPETRGQNSKAEPRVDISTYQYRIVPKPS